jgi:multidrug efflux pump subunit AcrA (membrane-fusion protein)
VPATLAIGLSGDPDGRTIDVLASASSMAPWARAGIAASLEVVLEGGRTELAIPQRAVLLDGIVPIVFRRDPKDPNKAIRLEADLGTSDGRFVEILSGVKEGDQIVVAGNYPLMLAMSGTAIKGGHFHADGTFHAEDH